MANDFCKQTSSCEEGAAYLFCKEGFAYNERELIEMGNLLTKQIDIAEFILTKIQEIAKKEAKLCRELQKDRENYIKNQLICKPRNVFTIEGNRGSGKSSLLLTLHNLIDKLSTEGIECRS